MDCVFCKIVKGEIPSKKEFENEDIMIIHDINPKASLHLLIIPKKHLKDLSEDDGVVWASIGKLAAKIAKDKNLKSFRLVHNAGEAAEVAHMHVHLLGGVEVTREI